MEIIDTDYAEKLHGKGIRPYTQSIVRCNQKAYWQITTLNEEAHEKIMTQLLKSSFNEIYLKHNRLRIELGKKNYEELSYQEMVEAYLYGNLSDTVTVSFMTPTSFKREGKYYNIPEKRLVFNSILNKFNVFSGDAFNESRRIVEYLAKDVTIASYNLSSNVFRLEGTTVPSFVGNIEYKLPEDDRLRSIATMLLHYGQYCGVGTKTAIGMGCIAVK